MKVALTGATGRVGAAVARLLTRQGHRVTTLGRRPVAGASFVPWALGDDAPDLSGCDALVHAGFAHVPGRYRGGEGDDAAGFTARNLDGTTALFAQAAAAGVPRIVFLSSRAVHDAYPKGSVLDDGLPARPDSLYGRVKAQAEDWLAEAAGPRLAVASLRATGVYGPGAPGQPHKWSDLFAGHLAGQVQPARIATEVHADDLAQAIALLLTAPARDLAPATFNASDILLDHHDLLAVVNDLTGTAHPLPPRSDSAGVSVMRCDRLHALGWAPRGIAGLRPAVAGLLDPSA